MTEFELAPGRYLVGVSGYDQVNNDPSKVMDYLESEIGRTQHLLGEYMGMPDEKDRTDSEHRKNAEPFYSAQFEKFFLEGRTAMIKDLIGIGV